MGVVTMGAQLFEALLTNLVVPLLTSLSVALGGWLLLKIPGPARRAVEATATKAEADTHARDLQVLVGALQRRATAEVADHRTPAPTAAELVEYLQRIKPDLLEKMAPTPEGLATMAQAAIATAEVALTAPVVVAPVDVLVTPGG
jgi:hypothetical protein